jgi:uncharacterized protein YkwD
MPVNRIKQGFVLALLGIALLWPAMGDHVQAALTPDQPGCPHSSDLPNAQSQAEARAAVLCLLNHQRVKHRLTALAEDPRLERAAQAHADDMGRRDFYAHRNPDGITPPQRIRRAGYDGRATGENIHWGVGLHATPSRIVHDWMNSPGHRANILRPTFTRVGTGIAYDPPKPRLPERAGVYVNNFGG